MPQDILPLVQLLADGKFHSGDGLGKVLGVSRAAIWKSIGKIKELGLEVHSVRGKGYRLVKALEMLNEQALLSALGDDLAKDVAAVELLGTVDSTNSYVMKRLQQGDNDLPQGKFTVCLAEQQSAGKGRRGREWVSPFGHNVYLSMAHEFALGGSSLEGLSLVVGLAVVKALKRTGLSDVGVKWPNDVLWQDRKIAGILLEMTGGMSDACQVVIGVGINVNLESDVMSEVDQPWVDLQFIEGIESGYAAPSRNQLIAYVVAEIMQAVNKFEQVGFTPFMGEWGDVDILKGRSVNVLNSGGIGSLGVSGIAEGISKAGAFLLRTNDGIESFTGGEVSVRRREFDDS